jgi:hypothetical protein
MSSTLEEVDLRPEPIGEVRGCEPYGLRTLLPGIGAVFDIVGNGMKRFGMSWSP